MGLGVTERSFLRRLEDPERDLRLRPSLTAPLSGEGALVCLFSLSLSRSELRRSVRSFDFGRGALTSLGASFAGLALRERVAVLRLVRDRSAPLLEDDEELDEDELLLEELDREPELLRDELLSDELEGIEKWQNFQKQLLACAVYKHHYYSLKWLPHSRQ